MRTRRLTLPFGLLALIPGLVIAAYGLAAAPAENDFYRLESLPIPEGVVLEVGGLDLLPNGNLLASSRRGDIYEFANPGQTDPAQIRARRFAQGLHEVLGLAHRDGWIYAMQRGELSRLRDEDGDGQADIVETVSDGWEIIGDYHEYAFGSKFDRDGNIWVALCLTGSFTSDAKFRGWALRISPEGKVTPTCSGLRSPGGIGMNCEGDMFFTENQGPWNGACSLKHLRPGKFVGNPAGNRWYEITDALGPRPQEPRSGSRMMTEAKRIPELEPPAVYFPYPKMGQSASGIVCDSTQGKFGPFSGQLFVGDQAHSTLMRVFLEKVQGHYQGACFPFRAGFGSGTLALHLSEQGVMYVGGTNRGWGSRGSKPFALERLSWTGQVPFEIAEMRARPDGFELLLTQPADRETASRVTSYSMSTFTYIYQSNYGSPEVDATAARITAAELSADQMRIRLRIDGLQEGHVHELHADGIRSREQQPLLHAAAYYTLNYLPE
jgi:glucose/arabinose dehydrogenase